MNFSFCVIAKDEAEVLPRLIASLQDFQKAGGVCCLMDTGSQDNTVQLAKDAGWIVKEVGTKHLHTIDADLARNINKRFLDSSLCRYDDDNFLPGYKDLSCKCFSPYGKKCNVEEDIVKEGDKYFDFASARNECAEMSPTDMVSYIDADEVMTKLDWEWISSLINDGYTQFEYDFVFSHKPDGTPAIEFMQSKFYDRRTVKWVGLVHEYLDGAAKIAHLPKEVFRLEHYQVPHDRHSYLKGLAVDCYLHPEKDRNSHYFARELMWSGRPHSAIKEFKRHVEMNAWPAERAQSCVFIGDCYGGLHNEGERQAWYHKAFTIDSSRRVALLRLAQVAIAKQDHLGCVAYAKASLEIPWHGFYGNDRSEYEHIPHELLYRSYGWIGRISDAQKHILEALKYQPYNEIYLRDTAYYFEYKYPNIDGWMTFEELLYLYELGKTYETIAEIGSWKGRSTHALLSGGAEVTAIDTWQGSDDENDLTNELAKKENIFEIFAKNTQDVGHLRVWKMTSEDGAATSDDKSFDVVFIDALHTYEGVKKDIELWLPKVKKIICGHDYDYRAWPGVCRAVNEAFGQPDEVHGSIWVKYIQ